MNPQFQDSLMIVGYRNASLVLGNVSTSQISRAMNRLKKEDPNHAMIPAKRGQSYVWNNRQELETWWAELNPQTPLALLPPPPEEQNPHEVRGLGGAAAVLRVPADEIRRQIKRLRKEGRHNDLPALGTATKNGDNKWKRRYIWLNAHSLKAWWERITETEEPEEDEVYDLPQDVLDELEEQYKKSLPMLMLMMGEDVTFGDVLAKVLTLGMAQLNQMGAE